MTALTVVFIGMVIFIALYFIWKWLTGPNSDFPDPDARVFYHLARLGSDFDRPHPIEFFLYLPTQQAAETVGEQLTLKGFSVNVSRASLGPSWLCFAVKEMLLDYSDILNLHAELTELAEKYGGEYDGWGTPVIPKHGKIVSDLWLMVRRRMYHMEEIDHIEE